MILKIQGKEYDFEIVSENEGKKFCFFIKAVDKYTDRFSCINNLNAVLSEFNINIDDPKIADSMWVVTKKDARNLVKIAKRFLSEPSFCAYLERQLGEDRKLGEWENIH